MWFEKEFLLFADVAKLWGYVFLSWLFLNLRWENVGFPRGAGWIIQQLPKGKIALLSRTKKFVRWLCPYNGKCSEFILLPFHFCFWLYAVKKWEQLEKMMCGAFLMQINICVSFCGGGIQRTDLVCSSPEGMTRKRKINGENWKRSHRCSYKQMLLSIQNNFWWNHNLEKMEMMIANTASICNHSNDHIRLYSWHTSLHAATHMVLFFLRELSTSWNMWADSETQIVLVCNMGCHSFYSEHLIKFSMHKQQDEFTQWIHPISYIYVPFIKT